MYKMYEFRYKTYKDFKFNLLELKPYCNKKGASEISPLGSVEFQFGQIGNIKLSISISNLCVGWRKLYIPVPQNNLIRLFPILNLELKESLFRIGGPDLD